jgi:ABC-type transport system involved in cytochrome c biogenesis permease subunit
VKALVTALLVLVGCASHARAQDGYAPPVTAPNSGAFAASDATLDALGRLPVQDGGRVKPLSTFAGFTLLRVNGRREVANGDDKLSPDAFLFETLMRPEVAATLPLFLVAEGAAIDAIGLDASAKKRRARWTFDELRPAVPRLFELAHEWGAVDPKLRTATQAQVVSLAQNVDTFLGLAGHLDFARVDLPLPQGGRFAALLGDDDGEVRYSQLVEHGAAFGDLYRELASSGDPLVREELADVDVTLRLAAEVARMAKTLTLLPPTGDAEARPEWITPNEVLMAALDGEAVGPEVLAALRGFEDAARATNDDEVRTALLAVGAATRSRADARGELHSIDLERSYYAAKPLTWSTMLYILGFVGAAFTWLRPRSKIAHRATVALTFGGLAFLVAAITVRCIIRERPPVSTLYETVLFVTATGSLFALVAELIDRRRIAVSAAAALGVVGLLLAAGYERLDAQDTMPELVAVLDTNFWLSTHVTTITIGYAAGMLAALLGSAHVVLRLFRRRNAAPELFRSLTRMTYGTVCFGLLFSLVGTILGGLWANESWGRFWGWDPKENGALLICLTMTSILHGRMAGHLKELGIAVAAAFLGTVVAFSWWGVNLLGVGLHSYGFTSGISRALWSYYLLQWGVCALGAVVWYRERARLASPSAGPASADESLAA